MKAGCAHFPRLARQTFRYITFYCKRPCFPMKGLHWKKFHALWGRSLEPYKTASNHTRRNISSSTNRIAPIATSCGWIFYNRHLPLPRHNLINQRLLAALQFSDELLFFPAFHDRTWRPSGTKGRLDAGRKASLMPEPAGNVQIPTGSGIKRNPVFCLLTVFPSHSNRIFLSLRLL